MVNDGFGDLLNMGPDKLIERVEDVPLLYRKFLATYYPEAHVRRAYLKSIGVIFADDSSFANMGFTVVPNSPSDVHVLLGKTFRLRLTLRVYAIAVRTAARN